LYFINFLIFLFHFNVYFSGPGKIQKVPVIGKKQDTFRNPSTVYDTTAIQDRCSSQEFGSSVLRQPEWQD
jgi:hypothetical protein